MMATISKVNGSTITNSSSNTKHRKRRKCGAMKNDLLRDHEEMEAAWNYDADADSEVDVRDPKPGDESATQDDVVNPRPLQAGERNAASSAGLRECLRAALAARHAGLGAGAAGGPEVLPVHAALLGEGLAAHPALLAKRATVLTAQRSGLHAGAASGSQVLAPHGVLCAESMRALGVHG